MAIIVGTKIPEFSSASTGGEITNTTFAGKKIVLYFYPKDNTPGCTQETAEFRDTYPQFKKAGTEVFGVSRDSLKSHSNFKSKLELPFELISDPEEVLCELFTVMKLKNMYGKQVRGIERSTFLIDSTGLLAAEWRGVKVASHVEQVLEAVKNL